MNTFRVLVADQHVLVRTMLRRELDRFADLTVVGEVSSVGEAVINAQQLQPDVVIAAMHLSGGGGLQACRQLAKRTPVSSTVNLSATDQDIHLARAWESGASGFLVTTVEPIDLVRTLRQAALGTRVFSRAQMRRVHRWHQEVGAKLQILTRREYDVLHLLLLGSTNTEIASELTISVKTVECHVSQLLVKLEAASRREIIAWLRGVGSLEDFMEEVRQKIQGVSPMSSIV